MRTDGLFTVTEVKINDWPVGKPLKLIPFGDVHRDSPAFCDSKWAEFLERSKKQKSALFLGMGDYQDGFSTSERAVLNPFSGLHDSTLKNIEKDGRRKCELLAKEIGFMKGRLIGLIGGNHYQKFSDGTTSDHHLANLMGTKYLGACGAIRLSVIQGGITYGFDIFAHHGRGGGRTASGKFKGVEDLAQIADADLYLSGDNHSRGAFPLGDKLRIVSNNKTEAYIRSRTPWIGRTGAFLKGYEPGVSSYVVDAALPPSNLGWIEFDIKFCRERRDGVRRTFTEISTTY